MRNYLPSAIVVLKQGAEICVDSFGPYINVAEIELYFIRPRFIYLEIKIEKEKDQYHRGNSNKTSNKRGRTCVSKMSQLCCEPDTE